MPRNNLPATGGSSQDVVEEDSREISEQADQTPTDVGQRLADEQPQSDESEGAQRDGDPDRDSYDYEKLVQEGSFMVQAGHAPLDGIELPACACDDGRSDSAFRDDVEAFLADCSDFESSASRSDSRPEDAADESDTADDQDDPVRADTVDWAALWDEFSFGQPGPDQSVAVSQTKLILALECSEQGIPGAPAEHIERGVDDGPLVTQTVVGERDERFVAGYLLT